MTRKIDAAAASSGTAQPRTPIMVGATEVAGFGSQFPSSPPPTIHVQEHDKEDKSKVLTNAIAASKNAQLAYDTSPIGQYGPDNSHGQSAESSRQHPSQRPRFDSLSPLSTGGHRSIPVFESPSSDRDPSEDSEYDGYLTPLTRRCSFRSDFSHYTEAGQASESKNGPPTKDYESSASDSTQWDTESSSEEDDSESSRPYTQSLALPKQVPNFSRGDSVVSDGGEQDHLQQLDHSKLKQILDTRPHPHQIVTRSSANTKSQRYALQKEIYRTMFMARNNDSSQLRQQFFPKDQLCNVINFESVSTELRYKFPKFTKDQIRYYANEVCGITSIDVGGKSKHRTYRSMFAILVLTDKVKSILSIMDAKVSDLDLPLEPVYEDQILVGMSRRRRRLSSSSDSESLLECFDDDSEWSPGYRSHFDTNQWLMLAPFFSLGKNGEIKHYPLRDQHILPFMDSHREEDDAAEDRGGYGKVTMVRIHPAHHRLGQRTHLDRGFAVKQLLINDRRSFKKERNMLKKFKDDHIVSLLATYRHRGQYHFIFDRAEGHLGKFWERSPKSPILDKSDIFWISQQCLGVAKGLLKIHRHRTFTACHAMQPASHDESMTSKRRVKFTESDTHIHSDMLPPATDQQQVQSRIAPGRTFSSDQEILEHQEIRYGRHGDINPQNILWFDEDLSETSSTTNSLRGILKIADFGTAELNSQWSKSGQRDVANTMTYRPPECDSSEKSIGQSFDIWCLGCVLLEFVTWMIGGSRHLHRFSKARTSRDRTLGGFESDTFFELVWNEDTYKTEARIKPTVIEFVEKLHSDSRCTEYHHDLLNLIMHDMLVVDSGHRITCKAVCKALKRIHANCQDETYAVKSSPWSNNANFTPRNFFQSSEVKLSREAQRQVAMTLPLEIVRGIPKQV